VRRKTRSFLDCAKDSLFLAVEMFNRPSDVGRIEGVLLFLNHAFEMLLKAVVLEKTGRIRGRREKLNYTFEKCLNICESQLSVIDKDAALILRNLNGFRDAAAHDLVGISEGLLYGHAQSAVQIFGMVLKKAFNKDLNRLLPRRVLPLSASVPTEISTVVAEDMAAIKSLLGSKRRREDEAEAKLRPYQVIEKNIRSVQGLSDVTVSSSRAIRRLKAGDWKTVMPMVAGLVQSTASGIPVSLHVTKREGFPVRIDPTSSTSIAFRYIKPEDKYPYLTKELADKLGTTTPRIVAFAKLFQMKGNDDFHTSIKISKAGLVSRYSEKARQVMAAAIRRDGVDQLWAQAKVGECLDPRDYLNGTAPKNQETTATDAAGQPHDQ
jgi:hypothetical protein